MNLALLLVLLIGFGGAIIELKRKHILSMLKPLEMLVLTSCVEFILLFTYLILTDQLSPIIHQLRTKLTASLLLGIVFVVCLILGSAFTFSWLTQREKISSLVPVVSVVAIIFTFLGGVFIYNEKWQRKDIFAIVLLIAGIFLLKSD